MIRAFILAALAVALLTPDSDAQRLDGAWFKLKANAAGKGTPDEDGRARNGKAKSPVNWALFQAQEGGSGPSYTVAVFAPNEGGGFSFVTDSQLDFVDDAETWVQGSSLILSAITLSDDKLEGFPGFLRVEFNGPARIKIKNEGQKNAELKSARISSSGAVTDGVDTKADVYFYGKGKLSMSRVPDSKVPEGLMELVTSGRPLEPLIEGAAVDKTPAVPPTAPQDG